MNLYEQLIITLKQVHEDVIDLMKPTGEEGLTHGHMFLLFMIYRKGTIKTTEISSHFAITPGAATAIADKLEKLELIRRERDLVDRRVVVISLSEKGQAYVTDTRNAQIALFAGVLRDLSVEELTAAIQTLSRISGAIQVYKSEQITD